ncbi:MAG: threonine/serine dehydratase [Caldilineaceae bacterium]|nr:threonine/serine dehydratase [Caldilineaceae bacterium]
MTVDKITDLEIPTLEEIRTTRAHIDPYVFRTPMWRWQNQTVEEALGADTEVWLKLELFQRTGTFKPRGAVNDILQLDEKARARGVTAVSAGNHAIAVAYAAQIFGISAKVVMPSSAPQFRVEKSRSYGAEVVLVADVYEAFAEVERIQQEEGRAFVHPFDSRPIVTGQATVGLEVCEDAPPLDVLIVPVGGGGLAAGISAAVRQLQPDCAVFGVEPKGADTMHRSFATGKPESIERVETIATSLGAPSTQSYSLGLCRHFLEDLALVSDEEMLDAMRLLLHEMKLAVEPACAASTAALWGPLREQAVGKRVGLILCGSNIGVDTFVELIGPGVADG